MRKIFILIILIFMAGCSLSRQDAPAFIPPSDFEATSTPNLGATLWAAEPPTENPGCTLTPGNTNTPVAPIGTETSVSTAILSTPTIKPVNTGPILYYAQAGDTLAALAVRFGVSVDEISSAEPIPSHDFIDPNQLLLIPRRLPNTTSPIHLLPDSEFVFALSSIGFDTGGFTLSANGYLSEYGAFLGSTGKTPGYDIVQRVALDNSINPRLLLALLEYQTGWVYGQPETELDMEYPLEHLNGLTKELIGQLKWAVNQLSIGYYGWREGRLNKITFSDGVTAYMAPDLNAGTAALQYYFAQVYDSQGWLQALDAETGFPALYKNMFGDPWPRARDVEPLFPADLSQPEIELPFLIGRTWSYTGGPHGAWEKDGS
ncbi:MAG: LysM peptidoglycan-binding domain-containing protein, partial [Chloroflexota bacterium]|nr:LysM peptidoglycan-binding domain-containing protein [Chloroflexota bacterium]